MVCLEALGQRGIGAKMGLRVPLAQQGQHLPSAVQDSPVLGATLALRDLLDHQVRSPVTLAASPVPGTSYFIGVFIYDQGSLGRRVSLGREAYQGLASKVLMVNQARQASQVMLVLKAPLDPLGIQGHRGPMAREVSSTTQSVL